MPQWTLFENDFRTIDQVLAELLERTNALSAHLIDRSGQLITSAGRVDDFDAMSFASLVAADFTANAELAQLRQLWAAQRASATQWPPPPAAAPAQK